MEIKKLINDEGYYNKVFDIELTEDDKRMLFCIKGADPHIEFNYKDLRDIEFPVSIDIYPDLGEFYELTDKLYNNIKIALGRI